MGQAESAPTKSGPKTAVKSDVKAPVFCFSDAERQMWNRIEQAQRTNLPQLSISGNAPAVMIFSLYFT